MFYPVYFTHLCLLVAAMHTLYVDHITKNNLEQARHHLELFYVQFSDFYGKFIELNISSIVLVSCSRYIHVLEEVRQKVMYDGVW